MPIRQFQAQRMHAPRDFQAIANESVCVEIGAGKGKHALLFSGQHPDKKLIAIERTREKFVAMHLWLQIFYMPVMIMEESLKMLVKQE